MWLVFTRSRPPFSGRATRAAWSTLTPLSPPRRALAWAWISRGRKWHGLLGTQIFIPSQLGDTPETAEWLYPEDARSTWASLACL